MNDHPLPEFFVLLTDAYLAYEEVESSDSVDEVLSQEENRAALALVEYCVNNAANLRSALLNPPRYDDPSRDLDRPSD